MTDSGEIEGLLARVSAATGPDALLDAEIMAAFYDRKRKYIGVHYMGGGRSMSKVWVDRSTGQWVSTGVFEFTGSADRILVLIKRVLPGYWWIVRSENETAFANVGTATTDYEDGRNCFPAYAATPALALLAALLKALNPTAAQLGMGEPT